MQRNPGFSLLIRTSRGAIAALALCAASAPTALAQSGEGAIAAAAPSSLSRETAAELAQFLNVPVTLTPVSASDHALARVAADSFDRLLLWNEVALDTTAIDHTPVVPGSGVDPMQFGEALGPHRASRAMAIVHIAMFEVANAIDPRFRSYVKMPAAHGTPSLDSAIAQAAHDTLLWIYPHQQPRLDALLAQDLSTIVGDRTSIAQGTHLGADAARRIVKLRTNDGSQLPEITVGTGPNNFIVDPTPGHWSPDPISGLQVALGARWGQVKPFVMFTGDQYRIAPPPALGSAQYARAYAQVKTLGGDPSTGTPTTRTPRQTYISRFWGYDGTPALCAPPRLYNMVARTVALQGGIANVTEMARYLALINVAMADAGVAAWDSKYFYQVWRPVTAIRADDPTWSPIGAPATNTGSQDFTPPFPAYPSGHAVFGGALFETMRIFFPDMTNFTFVSDEYNGINRDANGTVRPLLPEKFHSLAEAEYDNAESRIYAGVHWQSDADAGGEQGHNVARFVMNHAFQRLGR